MLNWALLGLIVFAAAAAAADRFVVYGYVTATFTHTIGICVIPYVAAYLLLDRTLHVPSIEGNNLVAVAALLPFAALLGFCAALRVDYSRGAMLLCLLISIAWLWLGYRRFVTTYVPVFGYFDDAALFHLSEILNAPGAARAARAEFCKIHSLPEAADCDGVMTDRSGTVDPERTRALARMKLSHVRLYSVDRIGELLTGRLGLSHIDETFLDDQAENYLYMPLKRIVDIVAVLCLAPIALPLSLVVGLCVKLESNGPAIFKQERVGLHGRSFTMLKFRSMSVELEAPARFAARHDPRVTRVGRLIRKYRFDELPQLWNVLVGDMSLIGPRPEQASLVDAFSETIPYYPYRHLVRPGLSGWAQVQQGYAGSHEETVTKLSYDLYYVKHCSAIIDLLICLKTVRILLTGYGAR